jgi:hypothetical protein
LTKSKKRSIIKYVSTGLFLAFAKAKVNLKAPFKSFTIRPKGHHTRSLDMKTFMNLRFGAVIAIVALAIGLSACGGGGSDTGSVPLASPFSGSVITQAEGTDASRQLAPQRFAVASSLYGDAAPLDAANQLMDFGEKVFPQFFSSHETNHQFGSIVYRYYPATGTYLGVAINTVPGDAFAEGGVYVLGGPFGDAVTYIAQLTAFITPVATQEYKVLAIWTEGYPFMVTKTTVTRVTNQTSDGLLSCGLANKALPDGNILVECTVFGLMPFTRRTYAVDPSTGILRSYAGAVPVDIVFTAVESESMQPVANTTSAHVADGWYYADPAARWRLLFQLDAGGTPLVVKEGTFATDGTIKVIRTYSN